MVRDKIKEIVDFATTESPYRSANKGWVTEDVYLQWGKSPEEQRVQGDQLVDISIFWRPINKILALLFLVFALATIFVSVVLGFSHGNLSFPSISNQTGNKDLVAEEIPSSYADKTLGEEEEEVVASQASELNESPLPVADDGIFNSLKSPSYIPKKEGSPKVQNTVNLF